MKVNISATEVLFPRRNVNRSRKNLLVWWVSGLIENKKFKINVGLKRFWH